MGRRVTRVQESTQVLGKPVPALGHYFCSQEACGAEPDPPTVLVGGRHATTQRCRGSMGQGTLQQEWGSWEGFLEERLIQENLVSHPISNKHTPVSKLKRK